MILGIIKASDHVFCTSNHPVETQQSFIFVLHINQKGLLDIDCLMNLKECFESFPEEFYIPQDFIRTSSSIFFFFLKKRKSDKWLRPFFDIYN